MIYKLMNSDTPIIINYFSLLDCCFTLSSLNSCVMANINRFWLIGLIVNLRIAISNSLPLKVAVKVPLDSRSANVHISSASNIAFPLTVSYGDCQSSSGPHQAHQIISTVPSQDSDRLVWILPEDISAHGCLSAWSARHELVGRSEPLKVDKYSGAWKKKRELDRGTKLSKRASIPMTNASGIDAQGPWFDGVELLKQQEIGPVDVKAAKAKSTFNEVSLMWSRY